MSGPKILTFDIETSPHLSWHFDTRNVNISPIQNVEPSRPICWSAKWLDKKPVLFHAEYDDSHSAMLEHIRALLDEADVAVTYNGDEFDIPRLQWAWDLWEIPRPSPFVSVDLYKVIKKAYRGAPFSRSLAHITSKLNLTGKLELGGYFPLWLAMNSEDEDERRRARARFKRYSKRDTLTTEELFVKERHLVTNMPSISLFTTPALPSLEIPDCPICPDGGRVTRQGYKRTKTRRYPQFQCQSCGRWFSQTRSEMGVDSS